MLVWKQMLNKLSGCSSEVKRTQGELNTETAYGHFENGYSAYGGWTQRDYQNKNYNINQREEGT